MSIKKIILEKLIHFDNKTPLLVCGDFNVNLRTKENHELIHFMEINFGLKLNTKIEESMKIKNSCIDLFLVRYINLNLNHCISYFKYHKSIFGLIKFDE